MNSSKMLVGLAVMALMACSPAVPKNQIVPFVPLDKVSTDSGIEFLAPKVDILFVIDNSGSMSNHQTNLAANVNRFAANFLKNAQIDFQIGVITTDNESGRICCGRLIGSPNFLDRNTPDFANTLSARMVVGTDGSASEKVFDPVYLALTEPNLSTANAGFLRQDAFLAIIALTDAEDQSVNYSADELYAFLVKLKGRAERVLPYGVLAPTNSNSCPRDDPSAIPARIERFLSLAVNAGSNSFSLCAPDFGDRLADVGKDLALRIGNMFVLNRVPVVSTIVLKYGTQIIEPSPLTGWSFDPSLNAIILGPQIAWSTQPIGTKLVIQYESTEFKDPAP